MKKPYRLLALAVLAALPMAAAAAGNAVYERHGDDGRLELTNIPDGDGDYLTVATAPSAPVVSEPAAAPQPPALADGPAAVIPAPISESPMADRLRELYSGAQAAHQAAGH